MTEPVQETIDPDMEAKAVARFYKALIDELHDSLLARDLAMAYVQSFNRRIG